MKSSVALQRVWNQPNASMTLRDVWARAVALAWKDASFKAQLLADPAAALKAQFGFQGLVRMNLVVTENATKDDEVGTLTLNLPEKPDSASEEVALLSDYQALRSEDVGVCFC